MTQLELFTDRKRARPAPIARSTDPATSHDAAATIDTGSLQGRCLAVLVGDMTANEIAHAASAKFYGMPDSYRKRVHELVRKHLAESCGERRCQITGINAAVYRRVG